MEYCLVLNASYEPLDVVHWQRAMVLWSQNKVEIIETHDREVRAVTFSFKLPSVVRLLRFIKTYRKTQVPFTRRNIYTRDAYTCQYCQVRFTTEDLTFDHVIPTSRGGPKTWENIVTACIECNRKKADRTPEKAGMLLPRKPLRPKYSPIFNVTAGIRQTPESWRSFLYWNVSLEN